MIYQLFPPPNQTAIGTVVKYSFSKSRTQYASPPTTTTLITTVSDKQNNKAQLFAGQTTKYILNAYLE
jgi:hypothetical protein